ncbi:hypothetical protein PIB30_041219 [Stylosanthes scabra]|uniref:Uncharacterized protein n=1 Tax=Stylosanthes scabra TaxID=79078 RepID=A0ABU6QEX5_9FABA|nr:hypothetical protein [Stylosanthes scabra]
MEIQTNSIFMFKTDLHSSSCISSSSNCSKISCIVIVVLSFLPILLIGICIQYMRNRNWKNKWRSDMNSMHDEPQLEEQNEFLCNVDEKYVPKVGMTFKTCMEANEFYKEYAKRAGFDREGKRTSDIPEAEKTNLMSPAN